MENKIICKNCGIEKEESKYYLSRGCIEKYMPICKSCFVNNVLEGVLFSVFRKYNIPFIYNLWDRSYTLDGSRSGYKAIDKYMKDINLPQYKNLTWKDSILEEDKESEKEINFYDGIVNNLKQEAKHLNDKISIFRSKHDIQNCIVALKALRETLDLIKKYDWNLMYSEYGVENDKIKNIEDSINIMLANGITTNNEGKDIHDLKNDKNNLPRLVTEIAVWEQNHEGNIRNHKVWRTDIEYKKYKYIVDNEIRP